MTGSRYARQICLPEVGIKGQERLHKACILVVGAGGLGSVILPILAGAGIGQIHVMDDDVVEEVNLHRQTFYRMTDIGRNKAVCSVAHLQALNPEITLVAHPYAAQPDTVPPLLQTLGKALKTGGHLVVVDAADNFATTYILSDLCKKHALPLISGSALRWDGYAGIFCGDGPSYRALFPEIGHNQQECRTAGILGPVVGMVGMLQAQLCLSLLLKINPPPMETLYRWDAHKLRMSSFSFAHATEPRNYVPFLALSQLKDGDILLDVRDIGETPKIHHANYHSIPLKDFNAQEILPVSTSSRIVICCQTGIRAARAAAYLRKGGYSNLALLALKHQTVPT